MRKESRITEAEITNLVDHFYVKVCKDDEIGPLFNREVQNWGARLALLEDFWFHGVAGNRPL